MCGFSIILIFEGIMAFQSQTFEGFCLSKM